VTRTGWSTAARMERIQSREEGRNPIRDERRDAIPGRGPDGTLGGGIRSGSPDRDPAQWTQIDPTGQRSGPLDRDRAHWTGVDPTGQRSGPVDRDRAQWTEIWPDGDESDPAETDPTRR
jgi:hypothetical protein